ncbi:MAG: metallophosphoesterase [Acidocella sp.]|nr:metallophosphoesterase [Acidocella sp.]
MKLSRRHLLASSATLTASTALPLAPASADAAPLNFVLIGDWGRKGHDNQTDVAEQMGKTAAAINSQFTISLGDNFYENGVESVTDPHWQKSFEQVYTAAALQSPWKITLGNHDYRGNVQAQFDYAKQSQRWQLPARYYQETYALPDGGKADVFYLDTSPFIKAYSGTKVDTSGQDSDAQLRWLDAALAASTAPWKIVIGHHPIYTAVTGDDHDQPDLIARLDPILRKHDVKIYINGHDHCLQVVKINGLTYVTNGSGSETYDPGVPKRDGFASGAHGFMTIALSSQKLDFSLIDMTGKVLYANTLTNT